MPRHPLYDLWRAMVARCHRPSAISYRNYGARGITVCDRWREDFQAFVADIPPRPSRSHTLDRRDNSRGYEPGNVRWATWPEQRRNSRSTPMLAVDGANRTLGEVAALRGIAKSTLHNRLRRGAEPQAAADRPVRPRAPPGTLLTPERSARVAALGLCRETVQSRLRRGWTFEDACTVPVDHSRGKKAKPCRSRLP